MEVRFARFPACDSALASLDPRWRLAGLLVALVVVAALRTWIATTCAFALALALAGVARMDWRWYLGRLAVLAALLAVFLVPLPLLARGDVGPTLLIALTLLLKALTLFTLTAILLVSAPLETTLKAAHALRVPGLLVQLALLSYRYLFVLGDELARLRVALRVRGFRNRPTAHSYRTVAAASGTLLVRGYERGERVAAAMRCRGFDGTFRALAEFRTSRIDVVVFLLLVAVSLALLGGDLYLRSGSP